MASMCRWPTAVWSRRACWLRPMARARNCASGPTSLPTAGITINPASWSRSDTSAGQGLNMGLKDVAALAEVVVDAARLGMDLGQADVLERYQRWRRFDTMAMGLATNSLNLLFSNESTLLRVVRDIGLGLVDRAPPLKNMFIRQAAGLAGEVPRLLKGEAL